MKWTATFAAAALSAALSAAPTANEDFVVAEAAAAYSNAVHTAGTNTAAAIAAESAALASASNALAAADESLSSRLSLASLSATNYTDAVAGQVRAEIPTDNAQLVNGAGYVTAAITNGLQLTETDPTVPAWAKSATQPLPPDYANVSNLAVDAVHKRGAETIYGEKTFNDGVRLYEAGGSGNITTLFDYAIIHNYNYIRYPEADGTLALESTVAAAATDATNYTDFAIGAAITNTNPVFSNAVLSVGLGIDTNAVAAINALVEAGDELPIGGATSVGALLLALAAAVAALKRTKADASALRYAMPESVALVAENDAATLVCGDRAVTNATIVTGFSTLNLSFPAEASGYVRDFYLRITVAAGESAPALSLPQGVTIENAGGAVPEIADGEASAAATTLVWFSETAPGIFTAKSETVKAVA